MIRLLLASYSEAEVAHLAELLEHAREVLQVKMSCTDRATPCRDCPEHHICADLLSATVYAKDYTPTQKQ